MDSDVSLQQESVPAVPEAAIQGDLSTGSYMMWTVPPSHRAIEHHLVRLCDSASIEIVLCALSFYDMNRVPAVYDAILRALNRGIRVSVVIRPEHFAPSQYPDPSTLTLINHGLSLRGMSRLHAKGIVVDSSRVALLSGNFNPYSLHCADTSAHVECGLVCYEDNSSPLAAYGKFLQWVGSHPTHRYVAHGSGLEGGIQ
jgi:phosphatidylserine/phosphatidylglycerophosphate/cardiolipin synthase-like enzyme